MDACLSPSEMERFAQGQLRGGARARAEAHLSRCAPCSSRIDAHRPAPATTLTSARPQPARPARTESLDAEAIEGFRLLDEIHRGGQGVVWRALDERRNEIVAVKILREGPFATADQKLRFDRESELASGLDHPLIVAPLQSGISRGRPYHVMKFVEGLTLDAWARETQPSLTRILEVFRETCDAVAHAHSRGVIHRDIKPANILVDARGKPHVVDFGVAKSSLPGEALPLTVTGEFVGTLSHASPEQAQGDPRLVDERTDVHALGLVLYQLLTGRMPYIVTGPPADVLRNVLHAEPKNPSSIDPAIDEHLSAIVLKALAKEPGRRYPSVAALRDDVAAFLAGLPVRARPASAWDLLAKTARRNRRWFVVAAGFASLLGIVAVLASVQAARFSAQRDRAAAAEADARARARELEQANTLARRQTHAAAVGAAGLAIQVGRLAEARRRLEQSPEELRGWEWAHLSLAADASEAHAPADGMPVLEVGRLPDGRAWRVTPRGLDILDATTLETFESKGVPDVPRPDEGANAEILTVAQDGSLAALRWSGGSWARLGAVGRSIMVVDFEGRIQSILEGAAWRPDRAAFSADSRRLAATTAESHDASPRAWSTLTGESRRYLSRAGGGSEGASPVAFSPDGIMLSEAGGDGRVRTWDVESGQLEWETESHAGRCTAIAWSRDGSRLATAGSDGAVSVLGRDGAPVAILRAPGSSRLSAVALDHDGSRAASGDEDGMVRAFSVSDSRLLLAVRGHETRVTALAFCGADDTLLSGAADGSLQRWRADDGAGPAPLLLLPGALSLAFSPDGLFIAAGSESGLVRVFDVAAGRVFLEFREPEGAVSALGFSPSGSRLATGGAGDDESPRTLRVRELTAPESPEDLGRIPGASFVSLLEDATLAGGRPGLLALAQAGRFEVHEVAAHPARAMGLARGTDGAVTVSLAWTDGSVAQWSGGALLERSPPCAEPGGPLPVAADMRLDELGLPQVAVATEGELRTCSGNLGELVRSTPLTAVAVAWSPDGTRLLAGDARGVLTVLSADPLEALLSVDAHDGPIRALAISPDGRIVASAGPEGVRLFRSR